MNRLKSISGFLFLAFVFLSSQMALANEVFHGSQEGRQQEGERQNSSSQQQEVLPDQSSRYMMDENVDTDEKRVPSTPALKAKPKAVEKEIGSQRIDSTNDDSVSKYNFIFYFLYKYKYDQDY